MLYSTLNSVYYYTAYLHTIPLHLYTYTPLIHIHLHTYYIDIKAKQDEAESNKQLKRQQDYEATVNSRNIQIQRKKQQLSIQKDIDTKQIQLFLSQNQIELEKEQNKIKQNKQKTVAIKHAQYIDGINKKEDNNNIKLQDKLDAIAAYEVNNNENDRVIELCMQHIEMNKKQGKPVYPLLEALAVVKGPRVVRRNNRDDDEEESY